MWGKISGRYLGLMMASTAIKEKFGGIGREKGVGSQNFARDYPFPIVGWFFKV